MALERLQPGVRWDPDNKILFWDEQRHREDIVRSVEEQEVITMDVVRQISGNILDCLNFTTDTPAQNDSKKMPVLDTQVWVGEEEREEGIPQALLESGCSGPTTQMGEIKKIILYQFYKKQMADRVPNRVENALPNQSKVTTAAQEVIRRMKNTSRYLPSHVIEDILFEYMGELRTGGYSFSWRKEVLDSATRGFLRMREKELQGKGHINRPETEGETKRRANRLVGRSQWFRDRIFNKEKVTDTLTEPQKKTKKQSKPQSQTPKIEGVMFVPFTGRKLKKILQELEDSMMKYSTVGRVKIVERAGATLAHSILNQTPWTKETCGRIGCKPCVSKPGSCKKKNLTYTI